MHRLILLRHAKSAYPVGVEDHDRPLNERGRRNAPTIVKRLLEYLPADQTVSAAVSTAVRAQQTWSYVHAATGMDYRSHPDLYLAAPDVLLEVASEFTSDIGIIVGHNPGLEELARSAAGARAIEDPRTSARLWEKFPTSAFAVVECASGAWQPDELRCSGFSVCR